MSLLDISTTTAWRLTIRLLLFVACLGRAPLALAQLSAITGSVTDPTGTGIAQVEVTLSPDDGTPEKETRSTATGEFSFANVAAGAFHLSFVADGFAVAAIAGDIHAGESATLPPTVLTASFATEVTVTPSQAAIAEVQVKQEEQQRIAGIIPNFYVSYERDAAPLTSKQKFELTWRGLIDMTAFGGTAVSAGIGQARNTNAGFGRGTEGYTKRYEAAYAELVTHRVIDKFVLTTVFKQDPRYFYKGSGSTGARLFYAISGAVLCRGDNRRLQFCFSDVIGRFAAGGLTNLYLPSADRDSTRVVAANAGLALAGSAIGNLLQEFVVGKLAHGKR